MVLELPFSNLVGSKLRPVLVVSNVNYNNSGNDILVAKITSSYYNTPWETKLSDNNLETGKLKKVSYIDSGFIFTIEKSIIKRTIAKIDSQLLRDVLSKVEDIFKLK